MRGNNFSQNIFRCFRGLATQKLNYFKSYKNKGFF